MATKMMATFPRPSVAAGALSCRTRGTLSPPAVTVGAAAAAAVAAAASTAPTEESPASTPGLQDPALSPPSPSMSSLH
uniref:VCP nuclear cofactor family member 2 n=1 Tax=Taeniopygia guttata TaxID=59729 RepID=H0YXH5_TAEGU